MSRPKPARPAYDDAFKEEAFAVWLLEADRNCAKTARILAELDPHGPAPSDDTIRRWQDEDDWDTKAQQHLATHYPRWYHRFHGRLLLQKDRQLAWRSALFAPDTPEFEHWFEGVAPDTVAKLRKDVDVASDQTLGLGMHGQKVERFVIPVPHDAAIEGSTDAMLASFAKRVGQIGPGERNE